MDIGVILTVLWPYLAALYLLDCFLVVRGGHMILSGTALTGFKARGPGLWLTGLLPWDWSILTTREPLLLSGTGLYMRVIPVSSDPRPPGPEDLELIPYEDMGTVRREGRKILVDGRVIHTAPTNLAAKSLTEKVKTILNTAPEGRPVLLQTFISEASDFRTVQASIEGIKRVSSRLIQACTFLFVLMFMILPVSLVVRIHPSWLWAELAMITVTCLFTAVLWWRAHRNLLPEESGDRLEELLIFTFFPVSLPHAFGKLTRRSLAPYDGAALTAVLEPSMAKEALEKEYTRVLAATNAEPEEDLKAVWNLRIQVLKRLAREIELDLVRLNDEMTVQGNVEEPLCPLCSATYREGITVCADCRVPLLCPDPLADRQTNAPECL